MRVLIVKTSALGDIIHALPVLSYLHQAAPGIEVDWLVEERFREVLDGNPLVDRLHYVRTKVWRKRPFSRETRREVVELSRTLRQRAYDMVFDIQGNLKSGLLTIAAGCPVRIGFTADKLQERVNLLFTTRKVATLRSDYHITDQYLRVVSAPYNLDFADVDLTTDIATDAGHDAVAEAFLGQLAPGKRFLFHQGTTWETKYWHDEAWLELGRRVLDMFPGSTLLFSWGNEAELAVARSFAETLGPAARVLERYPLKVLAALLKRVDLVVGGDTGPIHLAAAVGTPTVSLYRASDGLRSGPRGIRHAIIQAPMPCTKCFRTRCREDYECRRSITPKMVLDAIERVLINV